MSDARYIVGIDLGTTNSAVSYVDLSDAEERSNPIRLFRIPQMTGPGEVTRLPVLPSFLYIPGDYDIPKESLDPDWCMAEGDFAGAYARDHGAGVPSRLVSSAKSWLCQGRADRQAPILPYGADEKIRKVSPVKATAAYLNHIRMAWNRRTADEDDFLEHQWVIITVPASFDEVARELTVQAAAAAGLTDIILLEEPLAAFYSWLIRHEKDWRDHVAPGELILVCDVGGGTTDFTLISLREVDGSPRFERIAVGDHLILGGDNIDLALARTIEAHFPPNALSRGGDRRKTLCHLCRQAKERLLEGAVDSHKITLVGSGSRLIGGTLTADLDRDTAIQTVLEEFFPLTPPSAVPSPAMATPDTASGLPYESESAVTRHVGWFLERHQADVTAMLDKLRPEPDCILFNGGSLKPALIRERILEAILQWFHPSDPGGATLSRVLANPEPEVAVAKGAAYYGLVKLGRGVRVGSGSPRSYYLKVAPSADDEARGIPTRAMCVVERGLEEGSDIRLSQHQFEVLANQPVTFDIFSSSYRSGDRSGEMIPIDETLTPMAPIQTVIQYGKKGVQTRLPVEIDAGYTEMGVLSLWCRSLTSDHRWQLQFQLRNQAGPMTVTDREVFESAVVDDAGGIIREAFKAGSSEALQSLTRDVEVLVERPKSQWPLTFIRSLADVLLDLRKARKRSALHESRWLNLLGFCLRPGRGDGLDPQRIKKVWSVYQQEPHHPGHAQVQSEWWILWRRVAAGLSAGQQRQFLQDLSPIIFHGKKASGKKASQQRLEIWMALANMELLQAKDKVRCGRSLLSEIKPKTAVPQQFWSLSRFGARELLYGTVDRVIPPGAVIPWIEALMAETWPHPKAVRTALVQMARKTGDPVRDLDAGIIGTVLGWMTGGDPGSHPQDDPTRFLREVVPLEQGDESAIFGEALPSGLVLRS